MQTVRAYDPTTDSNRAVTVDLHETRPTGRVYRVTVEGERSLLVHALHRDDGVPSCNSKACKSGPGTFGCVHAHAVSEYVNAG